MLRMLYISSTQPLLILMVPLLFTLVILNGPVCASVPYLRLVGARRRILSFTLYSCFLRILFSLILFLQLILSFLLSMYAQLDSCVTFKIASQRNTNCIDVAHFVVCKVALVANMTAPRIPVQGSSLSNSDLWVQNVRIILPMVWWVISIIPLSCGFCVVMVFCYPIILTNNFREFCHEFSASSYQVQLL